MVNMFRKRTNHREELIKQLKTLHKDSLKRGISNDQFKDIFLSDHNENSKSDTHTDRRVSTRSWNKCLLVGICLTAVVSALIAYIYNTVDFEDAKFMLQTTSCAIPNNEYIMDMARPRLDCKMCENLHEVPVQRDITQESFKELYAYTIVPVLVKGATKDWSAMSTFSYQFFKDLYTNTRGALQSVDEDCQFFPYKTEFRSLVDVFNMSDERANFTEGERPWYIGWSNCHELVKKKLRQHYRKPYFLPDNSESSQLDWMFMGGTGPGAFIHIDFVQKTSWQAQITGKKTWRLLPSVECEHVCHEMNVTVHKGDIFVIDTNKWFHSTFIHPGEISITIGSEFD